MRLIHLLLHEDFITDDSIIKIYRNDVPIRKLFHWYDNIEFEDEIVKSFDYDFRKNLLTVRL